MEINKDYFIRELRREDGFKLSKWGRFNDPLYYGYEYNDLSDREVGQWYKVKTKHWRSEYFAIISPQDDLIGYIGMKEINGLLKTAKLGIVIDPNLVSKGYGTSVMKEFLDHVFKEKKMRRLDLEVNAWNTRALKLYTKFGFRKNGETFIQFENQDLNLDEQRFAEIKDEFLVKNNTLYSKIYKMSLIAKEYLDESGNRE